MPAASSTTIHCNIAEKKCNNNKVYNNINKIEYGKTIDKAIKVSIDKKEDGIDIWTRMGQLRLAKTTGPFIIN